ncbi:SPOR domain-containing protein [Deefgea tanakiae]|uniref:SPOR domain-containing protein n=1 Tax=Deefgea tanakiae TaxID=2865840 RepID=A0ABX8Z886_9NEIS|nr:SPOR domain-containing protein [Deefgea tanakiae]QZA78789.1 SPOR domain-containing protein [Deefgea tanakiae]
MANVSDELQQLRKRARRRLIGAIALVIFALTFLWTVLDGEPPKNLVDNHAVEIISSAPALSSTVDNQIQASAVHETAALEPAPVAEPPVIEASKVAPVALPGKLVSHQAEKNVETVEAPVVVATEKPVVSQAAITTPKPVPTKKPVEKPVTKTPAPKKPAVNPEDILEGKQSTNAAPPASAKKTYYIQVGAYADAEKAAELVSKLKNAGVKASSEKIKTSKGELTRVRVGPTDDEAKAKAWIKAMQEMGVSGSLVAKAAQ